MRNFIIGACFACLFIAGSAIAQFVPLMVFGPNVDGGSVAITGNGIVQNGTTLGATGPTGPTGAPFPPKTVDGGPCSTGAAILYNADGGLGC